jgi:phosphatidylethanolamine-binding protein (PEBP) family uncharacterized protein
MKSTFLFFLLGEAMLGGVAEAHSWKAGEAPVFNEALRAHILAEWRQEHGQKQEATPPLVANGVTPQIARAPVQAAPFVAFAPRVAVKWDDRFLYIESNGLPAHNMMVGITAWQQQVPLPQSYHGDNAWRLPLKPVPAKTPAPVENHFLRGAIAIAVNGIPIFNPQNNRGEISQEIGELDRWGGHCGRADDYHYHIAPLHLQTVVGKGMPIAFALDGYPIYGLTEPDGSPVGKLDECHGHEDATFGYHYHASMKRPYLQSAFHGEVVEAGGQVDPQPRAQPVREALPALRGAEITGFEGAGTDHCKLSYTVNGDKRSVAYGINADGTYAFEFDNGRDGKTQEVYRTRQLPDTRPEGPQRDVRGKGGNSRPMRAEGDRPPPPANGGGRGRQEFVASPDQPRSSDGSFMLTSPVVEDMAEMPSDYTGDGSGATLPLEWKGAPAGTQGFALIMDHTDPEGAQKWYWTLYDIPAGVTKLPRNVQGIGKVGTGFKGQIGYEPPHSKGPGPKTYVLTVYALSAPLGITQAPREVNREVLLAAMRGKVLAHSSLRVVHTSAGNDGPPGGGQQPERDRGPGSGDRQRRPSATNDQPPAMPESKPATGAGGLRPLDNIFDQAAQTGGTTLAQNTPKPGEGLASRPGGVAGQGSPGKGPGKGGPDQSGLIKPSMADTIKVNVYADNWFVLYINGKLTAVDSIDFIPHNVVTVDILPEYPMTIAVMGKDNADAKTGMEYGNHIGDGGFIIKFADGTVSNAAWKAKSFFKGPLNHDSANPKVEHTPIPENWFAVNFDDSKWANATEYTEERVNPKEPFYNADFGGAKFIWTDDLDLDNTIIFRTKIEKPGWTPRWNTKPDLDVTGAPLR